MKRKILFIIVTLLATLILGCNNTKRGEIYGKYKFNDVIYLSSLSSSSIDYIKDNMLKAEYNIEKDNFKIISNEVNYEISKPIYKKKKMNEDMEKAFSESVLNAVSIKSYKDKYQYTILNSENVKTNFYIYSLDDEVWIGYYVDNTADNSDILMYIYKLEKIN